MKDNLTNNKNENDFDLPLVDGEEEQIVETDDDVAQPKQNFVTGNLMDDEDFEKDALKTKDKKGKAIYVIGGAILLVLFAFAAMVFIITRGTSKPQETATIKDNTGKKGVNANMDADSADDYLADYQKRYGTNTDSANINGTVPTNPNANSNPNMGIAGFNPPVGTNGDIVAPPPPLPNGSGNPNAIKNSSSGGNSAPSRPVEAPTPNRNIEVVEAPIKDASYQNNSGGRNDQVSLFFYDRDGENNGRMTKIEYDKSAPVKPSFGTVLPVRLLGRMHTLGTNALARMELTRDVQGSWGTIPQGTMFVGRVSGGQANRLFVSLIGYIDSNTNRLVTLGGDLQGDDGALGMKGDVKRLGSRWTKAFAEVFSTAKQVGSAYLLGRSGGGTVINNGATERLPDALENKDATRYVVIEAGSQGYIVMNELPPAIESDERFGTTVKPLTDEEIQKMIQMNSPAEIERLIPQLSPSGKQIARRALDSK